MKSNIDTNMTPDLPNGVLVVKDENSENLKIDFSGVKKLTRSDLRKLFLLAKELAAENKKLILDVSKNPSIEKLIYASGLYSVFLM